MCLDWVGNIKRLGITQGKVLLASMIYLFFFSVKKRKPIKQIYYLFYTTHEMLRWGGVHDKNRAYRYMWNKVGAVCWHAFLCFGPCLFFWYDAGNKNHLWSSPSAPNRLTILRNLTRTIYSCLVIERHRRSSGWNWERRFLLGPSANSLLMKLNPAGEARGTTKIHLTLHFISIYFKPEKFFFFTKIFYTVKNKKERRYLTKKSSYWYKYLSWFYSIFASKMENYFKEKLN